MSILHGLRSRLRVRFGGLPLLTMALNLALIATIFLTRERWATWVEDRRFRLPSGIFFRGFVVAGGERAVLCGGEEGKLTYHYFDIGKGEHLSSLAGGNFEGMYTYAVSPAGDRMVAFPRQDTGLAELPGPRTVDVTPFVVDTRSGERLFYLRGHSGSVVFAEFSPDGSSIATAGLDRTVRVCDAVTGECRLSFRTGDAQFYTVEWSRDGRRILTQTAHRHGTCTWDAETGARLADFPGFPVFCAGGKRVVTYPSEAGVYDSDTGSLVAPFPGDICHVAVSTDETRIATLDRTGVIRVWDAETGVLIASSPHDEPFTGAGRLSWSPDASLVAVRNSKLLYGSCNAATGEVLFRSELRAKSEVRFSPDGNRLFARDKEWSGLYHIWDARTGRLLANVTRVLILDFFDENNFLATRTSLSPSDEWVKDAVFYRRIRPEWWWGVFYLPHFWVIAALAVALAASAWRDLRRAGRMGGGTTDKHR